MCEPTTLAITSIAIGLAGTGMSAYGQKQAAEYNADVSRQNATLARYAAIDATRRGSAEGSEVVTAGTRVISNARAILGGSGVDTQGGDVLDILTKNRAMSQIDAEKVKTNALREALGFKTQASNFEAQARLAEYGGRAGVYGTILTGAAGALGTGYSTGLFPKFGKA